MESKTTTIEKRDSIEVSKTATGKYSYKVKLYYDSDTEHSQGIIEHIQTIHMRLTAKFEPKDVK